MGTDLSDGADSPDDSDIGEGNGDRDPLRVAVNDALPSSPDSDDRSGKSAANGGQSGRRHGVTEQIQAATAAPEITATQPTDTEVAQPAPRALRLMAWLADATLVLLAVAAVVRPFRFVITLGVLAAYHTTLTWTLGQTLGKALVGLKVVRIDGREPTLLWSLGRSTVGYFGVDLFGLGLLTSVRDGWKRPLHDYVFSSRVVLYDTGPLNLKTLLTRFRQYAEAQKAAAKEKAEARKKSFSASLAFWAFLVVLADFVVKVLTVLLGRSIGLVKPWGFVEPITTKAASIVAGVTTMTTTTIVAVVPPARGVADWLVAPRCVIVCPDLLIAGVWEVGPFTENVDGGKVLGNPPVKAGMWTISPMGDCRGAECLYELRTEAAADPIVLRPDGNGKYFTALAPFISNCASDDPPHAVVLQAGYTGAPKYEVDTVDYTFTASARVATKLRVTYEVVYTASQAALAKNCSKVIRSHYTADASYSEPYED